MWKGAMRRIYSKEFFVIQTAVQWYTLEIDPVEAVSNWITQPVLMLQSILLDYFHSILSSNVAAAICHIANWLKKKSSSDWLIFA